ncbi:MAG: type I restriction-modification system subunit M [Candidatus Omnitrophica bacterium]|nr:type I restriction-modification system subunit M [Candidatus Omnitrophota bacterium]
MTEEKITLSQLEQYLSKAAWILKGPVDAADFKVYIFPLLFFKRISDVYDEEYQQALSESGGDVEYASLPEFHRFVIPEDCHWNDVREITTNVGQALQYAFREIEKANQKFLYGIFGDAQWTNKERLSDEILINLVEHFSSCNLSNANVEPDILGQAYEYLIKHFADLTNKKAGEFYTPRSVVNLMGRIIDAKPGESVYDPACGTGGMLLECINHLKENKQDYRTLKIFGQEKNLTTSTIARMNMFLHGVEDFNIVRDDTLRNPAFFDGDNLATFDCVIANPPFSLKKWGAKQWENDPYGRNIAGVPPDSNGDLAWVQHMAKSMAFPNGRIAVVLPLGALMRTGKEEQIRAALLKSDCIEAVIGLGLNIFYGASLAAAILVLRTRKKKDHVNKVLFIDGSDQIRIGRAQNYLDPEHVAQIYSWYSAFRDVDGYAKVVSLEDIARNKFSLSIGLYIGKSSAQNMLSLKEAFCRLNENLTAARQADESLKDELRAFKDIQLWQK